MKTNGDTFSETFIEGIGDGQDIPMFLKPHITGGGCVCPMPSKVVHIYIVSHLIEDSGVSEAAVSGGGVSVGYDHIGSGGGLLGQQVAVEQVAVIGGDVPVFLWNIKIKVP